MVDVVAIPETDELLTLNAAAKRAGVSRYTVEQAILHARLRAIRNGARILIPVEAVDQFIAKRGESPRRSA